MMCWAYK
jgi:hypothetical protein